MTPIDKFLFGAMYLLAFILLAFIAFPTIGRIARFRSAKRKSKFVPRSPFFILALFIGVLMVLCIPRTVSAQPYITNGPTANGPITYNTNNISSLYISQVRSNQANAGIYTGTWNGAGASNSIVVTFGHTYLNPPTVFLQITNFAEGTGPNSAIGPVVADSITPSNCLAVFLGTNVSGTFIAVGAP